MGCNLSFWIGWFGQFGYFGMHILTLLLLSMPALLPREDVSICQSVTASCERPDHNLPLDFNTFHTLKVFCSSFHQDVPQWRAQMEKIVESCFVSPNCPGLIYSLSFPTSRPIIQFNPTIFFSLCGNVIFRYNNIWVLSYLEIKSECAYLNVKGRNTQCGLQQNETERVHWLCIGTDYVHHT